MLTQTFSFSTNNFFDTINSVVNKYAPLKKVNKYKLRFKNQSILKANY